MQYSGSNHGTRVRRGAGALVAAAIVVGAFTTAPAMAVVTNQAPVASFTISAPGGTAQVGEPITFTSTSTDDHGIALLQWDFSFVNTDGFNAEGTGSPITHTYTSAGSYTVRLRVTDDAVPPPVMRDNKNMTLVVTDYSVKCPGANLGTSGDDKVSLGKGADSFDALGGNDSVSGKGGDDCLLGGSGDDTLEGTLGNDKLAGGANDDTLLGGDDNDTIDGNAGYDTIDGGNGDDDIDTFGDGASDWITCGPGYDTVYVDWFDNWSSDCENVNIDQARDTAPM